MENFLSDNRKLEKVALKNDAFLNVVVNLKLIDIIFENQIDSNIIPKEMLKSVKPVGTRTDTMYELCKVVSILIFLTKNDYTVKGSLSHEQNYIIYG